MKTHFVLKDNILDKNFQYYLNGLEFIKRSNINLLRSDIKKVTAKFFAGGDLSKAKTMLDGEVNEISRNNLTVISGLGGAILTNYLFLFLFVIFNSKNLTSQFWEMLSAQNATMRLTFIFIYSIFACGLCISIWRRHEINYMVIFEMNYKNKVSEYQLWTAATVLFWGWTLAFTANCVSCFQGKERDYPSLILIGTMLLMIV
jgi:hypothetical protein